ncbi:FtsW/RodA/SpoVE family cell cycle protein, partial [Porphyromonadaceae bacterium OttesenSCG-928-L07]|nr:FtsW/RodA/SpoVE family cell cycle protein [Porphyromonadaceae bacterium OttesenSCG-928-L07]
RVRGGDTGYYLIKQAVFMLVCLTVMLGLQFMHYKYFLSTAKIVLGISLFCLIWAKFAGVTRNDASRWVAIPFTGQSFQPSELAKIGIIMYTARIISFFQTEKGCEDAALKKVILYTGPLIFFIFLDNFSTSVLIGVICITMLFVGRMRIRLILATIGTLLGVVGLLVLLVFTVPQMEKVGRLATIKGRLTEFFVGNQTQEGYSYQSEQAKIAVARGGLFGVGPGNSTQRNFLPHPYSDFIFAIIIEEYGLLGGGTILLLYLIILFRVGVIVRRCTRIFPALLVVGLGLSIVFQAFINMAVCVDILPVTGQPLPLVSMGGTSLVFTSIAFGMILSVSNTFEEKETEEEEENETIPVEDVGEVVDTKNNQL